MPRQNNRRNYTSRDEFRLMLDGVAAEGTAIHRSQLETGFAEYLEQIHEDNERLIAREREERERQERERATRPIQPGQVALNKTQLREIMAHSYVWQHISNNLRQRINNAVASEGRLFRLTGAERNEIRNAVAHGRNRGSNARLDGIFNQTLRWS